MQVYNSCFFNYLLYDSVRCIQFYSSCKDTVVCCSLLCTCIYSLKMYSMVYFLSKPLEVTHEYNFPILSQIHRNSLQKIPDHSIYTTLLTCTASSTLHMLLQSPVQLCMAVYLVSGSPINVRNSHSNTISHETL